MASFGPFHRDSKRLSCADQHEQPLAPVDPGVEEVSLQQHIVLRMDRDDHGRELAPLALVDGHCVGGHQFVQFAELVRHDSPVVVHRQFRFVRVHLGHDAEAESVLAPAAITARAMPDGNLTAGLLLANYGICLNGLARYEEAESQLLEGYEVVDKTLGRLHPVTVQTMPTRAAVYDARGEPHRAAKWREKLPESDQPETAGP